MAVAYKSQGSGVATETSGAALSPLCPATVDAGDVLIAHVYWEGTTTAPSTPADWTLLHGPEVIQSTIGRHWVFGKIAAGTEDGAAVAFGSPAVTTQRGARVYSFSGRLDGTITQLVTGFAATSHATDPQMPTVTTTMAGALAVGLVAQNDNNTANGSTGETGGDWTEAVAEFTANLTPGLMLSIQTCTPTADPGTVTGGSIATTNDPCGVIGFQIKPSAVTVLESDGASTGSATTTSVGAALWLSDGASTGSATPTSIGAALWLTDAESDGVAAAESTSATISAATAASIASASVDGVGEFSTAHPTTKITQLAPHATTHQRYSTFVKPSIVEADGAAIGSAAITGIGAYYVLTDGASAGVSTTDGVGASPYATIGLSEGLATVTGEMENIGAAPVSTARLDDTYRRGRGRR